MSPRHPDMNGNLHKSYNMRGMEQNMRGMEQNMRGMEQNMRGFSIREINDPSGGKKNTHQSCQ